ncbi:unnamed protein product [Ceutorhynchus assimilis]|uniref:AAA+ ATPase domain-containing protein n=1 Tax=Ceutorhynchus assimilis TaxID=467358 RepID=A0A9N9MM55_9CUCU|nr:unnamed protein product [Ceutorhynchus assimilis]
MSSESQTKVSNKVNCPICNNTFAETEIEQHANKCIFLNCEDKQQKRKRSPSPVLPAFGTQRKFSFTQKSPRDAKKAQKPSAATGSSTLCSSNGKSLAPFFKKINNDTIVIEEEKEKPITKKTPYDLTFKTPLAIQVRPKTLEEFFGQNHILGKDTVLHSLLEKPDIPNMILWGPPGCGKTSLSQIVHETCKKHPKKWKLVSLCAATCGIKEVQSVVTLARNDLKFGKKTVLFMDEIHRFNKKQQDVFLMSVEKGEIILIGATTENPSFSLNGALLSRCRVVVLEKLNSEELYGIVENAAEFFEVDIIDDENPAGTFEDANAGLAIKRSALKWMADISDGDARTALGNLQLVLTYFDKNSNKTVTVEDIEEKLKKGHLLYDKAGEEHYNIISAMHKSIRGSDENAALYWTTRMIVSGEDPRYIARRMVRAASEDIGNADPHALPLAVATMQGCQLIGMPEADVLLAQCAIYLARAPKSREADSALAKAKRLIKEHKGPQPSVPMHIRNAPTTLMKNLGYGTLEQGTDFTFLPPEYSDVNFFQ